MGLLVSGLSIYVLSLEVSLLEAEVYSYESFEVAVGLSPKNTYFADVTGQILHLKFHTRGLKLPVF